MENRVTQLVRGKLAQFGLFVLWPSACNSIHDLIFECFDTFFLSPLYFNIRGGWRERVTMTDAKNPVSCSCLCFAKIIEKHCVYIRAHSM